MDFIPNQRLHPLYTSHRPLQAGGISKIFMSAIFDREWKCCGCSPTYNWKVNPTLKKGKLSLDQLSRLCTPAQLSTLSSFELCQHEQLFRRSPTSATATASAFSSVSGYFFHFNLYRKYTIFNSTIQHIHHNTAVVHIYSIIAFK